MIVWLVSEGSVKEGGHGLKRVTNRIQGFHGSLVGRDGSAMHGHLAS